MRQAACLLLGSAMSKATCAHLQLFFFSLLSCLFFLFFFFFFFFKGLTFGALELTPLPFAALLAVVSLTFHICATLGAILNYACTAGE